MAKEQNELASFSAKELLLKHGEKGTVIDYNERQPVEIVKATKYYKVGDVINPHKIKGAALIEQGIAKAYKPKKEAE